MCFQELRAIILIWELPSGSASLINLVVRPFLTCGESAPALRFVLYLSVPSPPHLPASQSIWDCSGARSSIQDKVCHVWMTARKGQWPGPRPHVTWRQGSGRCQLHLLQPPSVPPFRVFPCPPLESLTLASRVHDAHPSLFKSCPLCVQPPPELMHDS